MKAIPLLVCLWAAMLTASAAKPNVLFIAVDDLNDWIGCLGGHSQAKTPNIDRLAARGMLFANAHCAAPACNPSRAALMTGIRPASSGVYLNPMPWRPAMPTAVTLPQHFMANGYTAMGSGKIYHGAYADAASWDVYWPSKAKQKPNDPRPKGGVQNMGPSHFDWAPIAHATSEMGDAKVADWISKQLGKSHDKPFFLACGFYRPHLPWYAPQAYFDRFPLEDIQLPKVMKDDLADIPEAGLNMAKPQGDHARVQEKNQWRQGVQAYLACISFVDEQVGRVLDALDASPHAENTIIVFWTDHGWHLGEKEHWRKFSLWEEATRTPMIVVAPKAGKPGRCDRAVNLLDIYPTLVDLCELSPNPALEGQSLVPLLKRPKQEWERPSLTTHGIGNHSLRGDRYRYIQYADGSEELYDHETDPGEHENLAATADLAEVKASFRKWLPARNAPEAKRD